MKHKSDFNKLFAIEVEALFTKGHLTNESITLDKVLGSLKLLKCVPYARLES